VRFSHRLLFSGSLNWLFLSDRSWVLNYRLFNRSWVLNGLRICFRRRFRICGFLLMVSRKLSFKSFNVSSSKYRINRFEVRSNLLKISFCNKTIFI
jgi:hypothetical protein